MYLITVKLIRDVKDTAKKAELTRIVVDDIFAAQKWFHDFSDASLPKGWLRNEDNFRASRRDPKPDDLRYYGIAETTVFRHSGGKRQIFINIVPLGTTSPDELVRLITDEPS